MDSLGPPEGEKLRKIEAQVFRSQRRAILKDLNNRKWKGSKEQNQYSDMKVSAVIKKAIEDCQG